MVLGLPLRAGLLATAATAAFAGLSVALFCGDDLPSPAAIRREAESKPERDRYCDELRGTLGNPSALPRDEALRRIRDPQGRPPQQPLDLRLAALEEVKLDKMVLAGADLRFARLEKASLEQATFAGADLSCARLTQATGNASFRAANLTGAVLVEADLQKSSFVLAHLNLANLTGAVLRETDLGAAKLIGARLVGTDLDKASLAQADVQFADYRPTGAPRAVALKNLGLTFPREPDFAGLATLRKSLVEAGDNTQARLVTYAIETWRDEHRVAAAKQPGVLRAVLLQATIALRRAAFDWTVAYGARPSRALLVLAWSGLIFAFVYWLLLRTRFNTGEAGLVRVLPKGSVVSASPTAGGPSLPLGGSFQESADAHAERVGTGAAESIAAALWFSALSATRFGYGSFTLSSWLGALGPGQEEYRALGLIRTVSGLQGLLSLYLLVLFAVTLFGDPFSLWP